MLLEQRAHLQLQVLVVERARLALRAVVLVRVAVEERLQRLGHLGGQEVARHQLGLADQLLVGRIAELELLEVGQLERLGCTVQQREQLRGRLTPPQHRRAVVALDSHLRGALAQLLDDRRERRVRHLSGRSQRCPPA